MQRRSKCDWKSRQNEEGTTDNPHGQKSGRAGILQIHELLSPSRICSYGSPFFLFHSAVAAVGVYISFRFSARVNAFQQRVFGPRAKGDTRMGVNKL